MVYSSTLPTPDTLGGAPPLPEYPHSTNPRILTHVDGLNLDASASPAPQESAPGCFSDSSWGTNHNC